MSKLKTKKKKVVLYVRVSEEALAWVTKKAKSLNHTKSSFMDMLIQNNMSEKA